MAPVKELAPPGSRAGPPGVDEVIAEARSRARRRRLGFAAAFLAAAAVAAGLVAAWGGGFGGGHSSRGLRPRPPARRSGELQSIERAAARGPIGEAGLVAARSGWAMNGLGAWITFDGGGRWQAITPPHVRAIGDAVARIIQIEFADQRHGWISATDVRAPHGLGRQGEIDRTADGGRTWRTVTPQDSVPIAGAWLSFLDARRGFALTAANRRFRLYRTSNGGAAWKLVSEPSFGGAIVFVNTGEGFGAMRRLYRTTDGGRQWNPVVLPVPPRYAGLPMTIDVPRFFGPRDGVVSARVRDQKTKTQHVVVYTTHDGGATWSAHPAPPAADLHRYTFGCSGGTPFSAASASNWKLFVGRTLYATNDAGLRWTAINVPVAPKAPAVWDVDFTSPSSGWAIFDVGTGPALVQTTDGGLHWSPVHPPAMRIPPQPASRPACGSGCRRP